MRKVEAIFCSDIHASSTPPVFRDNESDWFEAILRIFRQLKEIQKENGMPPIIIAGDIFDIPKTTPDIVNILLREMPDCVYAIPGQHDLPYHNFEDIQQSSFDTLVAAGRINLLDSNSPLKLDKFNIYGFPFGKPIEYNGVKSKKTKIAVIHSYIWIPNHNHVMAAETTNATSPQWKKILKGFDIAVFGDNHSGFTQRDDDLLIYNCGCFMRRKQDEIKYKPAIGLLTEDGYIERHFLDCSLDKYSTIIKPFTPKEMLKTTELIDELNGITDIDLDIDNLIEAEMNIQKVNNGTRKFINKVMEDVK